MCPLSVTSCLNTIITFALCHVGLAMQVSLPLRPGSQFLQEQLLQLHMLRACHQAGIQTWPVHRTPEASFPTPGDLLLAGSFSHRLLQQQDKHRWLQQGLWLTMLRGTLLGMTEGEGVQQGHTPIRDITPLGGWLVEGMVHMGQQGGIRLMVAGDPTHGPLLAVLLIPRVISQLGHSSGAEIKGTATAVACL